MTVFRDPFNELLRLQQELESLLDRPTSEVSFAPSAAGVFPPVNVFRDRQGDVVIRAELPGVKSEDIEVTCEAQRLTIKGERKAESGENAAYHRRERRSGKFSRHPPAGRPRPGARGGALPSGCDDAAHPAGAGSQAAPDHRTGRVRRRRR